MNYILAFKVGIFLRTEYIPENSGGKSEFFFINTEKRLSHTCSKAVTIETLSIEVLGALGSSEGATVGATEGALGSSSDFFLHLLQITSTQHLKNAEN